MHTAGGAHALERADDGLFTGRFPGGPGDQYLLAVDGAEAYPDPCSRYQPHGVRGPSQVVDPAAFEWTDSGWRGVPLDELVVYELHVGTFSEDGTFDGVLPTVLYYFSPTCGWCERNWDNVRALSAAAPGRYRFIGLSSTPKIEQFMRDRQLDFEVYTEAAFSTSA